MRDLKLLVELSHDFGTADYVKGGGGNTSVKNESTLWVKPSGTRLAGLSELSFVAMNRAKINELYSMEAPEGMAACEERVNHQMAAAVVNNAGRPSVEAPLHNVFEAKFVVHTHPFAVNGLTCAKGGEPACRKLFPEALWVEYVDPGYTLCMEVRKRIETYKTAHGRDPSLLMLKNHGIFIAADRAEEIRELTAHVMDTLRALYTKAALSLKLEEAPGPEEAGTEAGIRALFGRDGMFTAPSGRFAVASGPITPDHLVYANAFPFTDPLTAESAARYKKEHGYAPKVVVAGRGVYGIGTSQVHANLALDLAKDGAQVVRLTEAFGGIEYMTDSARKFIENWEVESYRKKQVSPFPSPP